MADNDFLLKVLERFYGNCIFFPNFRSKVYSQDLSTNEPEVVSD